MFFYEIAYNISLQGKFNLSRLHQTLKNHLDIQWEDVKHHSSPGVFEYILETETGIAEINVFVDNDQHHYANQMLFIVTIATPPQFIEILINFVEKLAALFIFSMQAYEIRMSKGYSLGWYQIDDYERLRHDYQEIHEIWRARTGSPAFKSNRVTFPRDCIYARVRQRQQPISMILCPKDSEVDFYQLGGFPYFAVVNDGVSKDDLYKMVRTIQLEQGKLLGNRKKLRTNPQTYNSEVRESTSVEVLLIEIDSDELELEIHINTDSQVGWIEYQMGFNITGHIADRVLRCLVELAEKLDWHVIEGFDFQKFTPADLDTQKLIEFITGLPK